MRPRGEAPEGMIQAKTGVQAKERGGSPAADKSERKAWNRLSLRAAEETNSANSWILASRTRRESCFKSSSLWDLYGSQKTNTLTFRIYLRVAMKIKRDE